MCSCGDCQRCSQFISAPKKRPLITELVLKSSLEYLPMRFRNFRHRRRRRTPSPFGGRLKFHCKNTSCIIYGKQTNCTKESLFFIFQHVWEDLRKCPRVWSSLFRLTVCATSCHGVKITPFFSAIIHSAPLIIRAALSGMWKFTCW